MITDDAAGNATYSTAAQRPTFYGTNSIRGKSMVIYEDPDDMGMGGNLQSLIDGNVGRRIACCNISRIRVVPYYAGPGDVVPRSGARMLAEDDEDDDDVEEITPEQFYEIFGEVFEGEVGAEYEAIFNVN